MDMLNVNTMIKYCIRKTILRKYGLSTIIGHFHVLFFNFFPVLKMTWNLFSHDFLRSPPPPTQLQTRQIYNSYTRKYAQVENRRIFVALQKVDRG